MIFINANILTMDEKPIENGFVAVKNGKITKVGNMDKYAALPDTDVIDLNGKWLMPGFIDAHSHLGLFEEGLGIEGDDLNEDTDPITPHIRALDGINPQDRCFAEARQSGTTCAVISPGSANPIAGQICAVKTAGRWVDKMIVAEPVAMKFAMGENPKMSYANKSQSPVTRMASVAMIREQLYKASHYLESRQRAEEDPDMETPDYDARLEALIPVLKRDIRAHFHAHKAYDILSAIRIAEEFSLDYTIIHCTEGHLIADILGDLKARVICGPLLCARTKPELANLSGESCGILSKAGVTVAISTDYPEIPIDFLLASAAFAVTNGMPRDEALRGITLNAAKAAGLENRLGSITKGKDADLLVFGGDPLQTGIRPEMVFINGEKIV